jgi:alpha-methylacyl-CoA racemase
MTGWGQDGPLAQMAGHDINYIAMSGALAAIGPKGGAPTVPLNLVGDFAGGSLYLAMGLLAALVEARQSGRGQVIDAAMLDGVANLLSMHLGYRQAKFWNLERGTNSVDGGAPWYATYATSDGRWIAVGAVEKRFYAEFVEKLGFDPKSLPPQHDRSRWGELHDTFAAAFAEKTRAEWEKIFEGSDACVSPVLDMDEAPRHPAANARNTFVDLDGVVEAAPAPRFSRTPTTIRNSPPDARRTTVSVLAAWGIDDEQIRKLERNGQIPPSAHG